MDHAQRAGHALRAVREQSPLVHNITNYVAMDLTANALLAIGAAPAMVHAEEEVEEFVDLAASLVVNIGTLSPAWVRAMHLAARRAAASNTPWVLDPVGAGATAYRTRVARELAELVPTVIRGNASEIIAVAGGEAATRGVDSVHGSHEAAAPAAALARARGCVVVVSGEVDVITDGHRGLAVRNGDARMTRVTALGCTASALVAAFCAVEPDALHAAAAAMAVLGRCGELAAAAADGPGSLRVRLLDHLHTLGDDDVGAFRIEDLAV